jgi:putative ABC transport system ATP-binding protein
VVEVNGMPVIEAQGLEKTYRRGTAYVHAVADVALSLMDGELVALIGRSGSGKTTLLTILAGWERPDAGIIRWRLSGANHEDPGALSWDEVALLPQSVGLLDELTVRKNVELPLRLAGRLTEGRERVPHVLHALGLTDVANRLPYQTSMGQQQRTGLARAVIAEPTLLLADEPTGHQDAASARRVFDVMREATAMGTCALVATHNDEVVEHADRVIRMEDGRLIEEEKSTDRSNL